MKKLGKVWLAVLLGSAFVSSSFLSPKPEQDGKIRTLVIDAGHGGKDPGALGSKSKEKEVTLAIALELRDVLKEHMPDLKVILTRDDDTFVELHKRAAHAQDHDADFFVSIHCNSNSNKNAYGSETYILGAHADDEHMNVVIRENKSILMEENYKEIYDNFDPESDGAYIIFQFMASVHVELSNKLAAKVQDQFRERVGRRDRGVKQAGYLVLWKASRPSILIETGFISNNEEEKFLDSETGQTYIASAIYRAIKEYNNSID